jgi:hypothetical protein
MYEELFNRMRKVKLTPRRDQLVELLQETWADISIDECASIAISRRPTESISKDDLARVELTPDDVRSGVFCNILKWKGTANAKLLTEWLAMPLDEQNQLLIEAFPDGRVYGV